MKLAAGQPVHPQDDGGSRPGVFAYRFLWSWRWFAGAVFIFAAVTACILLGNWQLGRYHFKVERADIVNTNIAAAAKPLADVVPRAGFTVTNREQWTKVEMRGHYLPEQTLLNRNRPVDDQVGFYVLVPFETQAPDGTIRTMIVNRGWIPTRDNPELPSTPPTPPQGTVTVTGRIRVPEPTLDRPDFGRQVQSINVPTLVKKYGENWPQPYTGAFVEIVGENPRPAKTLVPPQAPETDLGPHLGYTFQWYLFAACFPIGFVIYIRRSAAALALDESDSNPADEGGEPARGVEPKQPAKTTAGLPRRGGRSMVDEDAEDSIIDEWSRSGN